MRRLVIVLTAWAMLTVLSSRVSLATDVDAMAEGRACTAHFYANELDAIVERFTPAMTEVMSLDELQDVRSRVDAQLGLELDVIEERVESLDSLQVYLRRARFEKLDASIDVIWAFTKEARIAGFRVRPTPTEFPSTKLDYEPHVHLRLPFDGEWTVFWGGRTIRDNYHAMTNDQRFAYDVLIMRDGRSHDGEGGGNEAYYCYGEPVLAPAAGRVVEAVDGIDDNVPGVMNPRVPLGNHVVLDHGNDEYSFLAHFQKGSLAVSVGDSVTTGQRLGLCGNSGNSSEPHVHVHLQNTPTFGAGDGLPGIFYDFVADGVAVDRGEPTKGQVVRAHR